MSTGSERLSLLRSVSIFRSAPPDLLSELAPHLTEITIKAGESIIKKGDYGDSMFIIVEGRVKVHDGDLLFNYLEKLDVFGEMSALDPEPRSASVTALEETRLYSLSQSALTDLMAKHSEVGQGIIRILCQRLRDRIQDMTDNFEYMQQFSKVTAAAVAVEAGIYEPESLDDVARRTDELGHLARVFQRMESEVNAREQRLKKQVAQLKIEIDQVTQTQQVAEITETEYFQALRKRARDLRESRAFSSEDT